MVTLREVMSLSPPTVRDSEPVDLAIARMRHRWGQPSLVFDARGALVGVLRDVDLLRAQDVDTACGSLVTGPPRTMDVDTLLIDALNARLGCRDEVIVVVDGSRPVGTLGDLDIARVALHLLPPHEQVASLHLQTRAVTVDVGQSPTRALALLEHERGDIVLVTRRGVPVAVMEREEVAWLGRVGVDRVGEGVHRMVLPVTPRTSLRRVAHDMLRTRCGVLPVRQGGGRLLGVVSLDEIAERVRALLEDPPIAAVA